MNKKANGTNLALGIGRARVEDGTGVEALSVAANLGRATLVIGSTAWGFCRAWCGNSVVF